MSDPVLQSPLPKSQAVCPGGSVCIGQPQVAQAAGGAGCSERRGEQLFLSHVLMRPPWNRSLWPPAFPADFLPLLQSKEDVMVERSDRLGELLLDGLATRPLDEPPC